METFGYDKRLAFMLKKRWSRDVSLQMNSIHNERKNYIWNMIAGLINASEAVLLLAVVSRTNGIHDAGVLTIAFAIANLVATIGKFGMRNYQVTDIRENISFNTYFTSRIVTVGIMILVSVIYVIFGVIYKGYSLDKGGVILFLCMIYAVEAIEDVFAGLYQREGRLDIGGKIFSIRWIMILLLFSVMLCSTHNLLLSSVFSMLLSVVCCVFLIRYTYSKVTTSIFHVNCDGVKDLLIHCAPLFLSTFLQFYLVNASKYAIDTYLTEEIQACYGFVAMPVFVIGLLNSFLYQPIIVQMAIQWREGDLYGFAKQIWKQLGMIAIISIVCLLGAYLLGVPVLSLIYNTDLSGYKTELMILLIGGSFFAVVGFFCVVLTTMRAQRKILYGHVTVAGIALFLTDRMVQWMGITGAAWVYTILMLVLATIFGINIVSFYKKYNLVNK